MIYVNNIDERKNFLKSIGVENEEELYEKLGKEVNIYLQSYDELKIGKISNVITAYAVIKSNLDISVKDIQTIKIETRLLSNHEDDNHFSSIAGTYYIKIINQYNQVVAVIDIFNNLHICDFYHNARDFSKEFFEIVKIWNENKNKEYSYIYTYIYNILKNIDAVKIEEVKISFDRDAYAKQVERILEERLNFIKNIYEMKVRAVESVKNEEIETLKRRIEEERTKSFIEGMKLYDGLKKAWKIEDNYLVYSKRIIAKKVKDEGVLYKLNTNKFYIKDLRIALKEKILSGDVICSKAYHPNVYNSGGTVCIGDLEGKNLSEVIKKIVDELQIINMNSAYNNSAYNDLKDNFEDYIEEEGEIWTA